MAVVENVDLSSYCLDVAERARKASAELVQIRSQQKSDWLCSSAALLRDRSEVIAAANAQDLEAASGYGLTDAQVDRLRLTPDRLEAIAVGLEEVAALADKDTTVIKQEINQAETTNRLVRMRDHRAALVTSQDVLEAEAQAYTVHITAIDDHKRDMLAAVKLPVDGLTIEDDCVYLNEIPLDGLSGAQLLRLSVAIGLAANPTLKVMTVKDASLLDEDSLKIITDMAIEADAQVWLEIVGTGDGSGVLIEEGEIVEGGTNAEG